MSQPSSSSKKKPSEANVRIQAIEKALGAVSATVTEMALFHPFDTFVKNSLHSKGKQQKLIEELRSRNFNGKLNRLYQGFTPALVKKGPQRAQKWIMQDILQTYLEKNHRKSFEERFGKSNAKVYMNAVSGSLTGMVEPIFIHPFDTVQIMKQNTGVNLSIVKTLGIRGLYRGALFTSLCRNAPGAGTLFGGSELLNHMMKNDDRSSYSINFTCKVAAAVMSSLVSQPGDVIKTKIQTDQVTLRHALATTTYREMFTNGIGPRLVFASTKVAFGFFMYEELLRLFERIFEGAEHDRS